MERNEMHPQNRRILSSAAPPPVPTAKGSRSAADPILSEYIDKSVQIPELTLPQNAHLFKPEEIDYESLGLGEDDSTRRLLRSIGEFGAVLIRNHGILTEDLRFALDGSEGMFGLAVECCGSYGGHERIVWRGGDDHRIMEEAAAAIGEHNYQIFRQEIENVERQLKAIAQELAKVIAPSYGNQIQEPIIQFGESKLSIYRYHQADIVNTTSSILGETSQDQSGTYGLSLHLLLEPTEFRLKPGWANLSFHTSPNTIVVILGKELEEKILGEFKSAQEKLMFKPLLHLRHRASFSIEQKWSANYNMRNGESNKIVSLQIRFRFY